MVGGPVAVPDGLEHTIINAFALRWKPPEVACTWPSLLRCLQVIGAWKHQADHATALLALWTDEVVGHWPVGVALHLRQPLLLVQGGEVGGALRLDDDGDLVLLDRADEEHVFQ